MFLDAQHIHGSETYFQLLIFHEANSFKLYLIEQFVVYQAQREQWEHVSIYLVTSHSKAKMSRSKMEGRILQFCRTASRGLWQLS